MIENSNYADFDGRLNQSIYAYIGLGFGSILSHYLMHVCWNTACARQIKRMKYELK